MPRAVSVATEFIAPLNQAMDRWKIDNAARIAAFLAQAAHESGELLRLEESLNYTAERLQRVWPARFDAATAAMYAKQPAAIANHVYADRLGNGPTESGDGWRYRGRGIFQLTGKRNYRDCSIAICGDADTLLLNPELLASPAFACESAGWFWHSRGLSELADRGGFQEITRRINGALAGWPDRLAYWNRAVAAMAAT